MLFDKSLQCSLIALEVTSQDLIFSIIFCKNKYLENMVSIYFLLHDFYLHSIHVFLLISDHLLILYFYPVQQLED